MTFLNKLSILIKACQYEFVLHLPQEFTKFRVRLLRSRGVIIDPSVVLSPNVRIRGKIEIKKGTSIAHNCSISGENAGVFIGENVMIASNVVIVAFNHVTTDITIPMIDQGNDEAPVIIEDDVWIASNCTISKGVTIGKGSVVAANSFVNKNVAPYTIVGGVPAKVIKERK